MTQSSENRWIFDLDRLKKSPSARDGIGHHQELMNRHRGTNLIREMAQELKLRPIVMQTAMVYFHRFFTIRSFAKFDAYRMAVCALFLASKWDDQPIFREHIIKLLHCCKPERFPKESYNKECELLVDNEAEMLFTFGFDLTVTHSHTIIAQDFNSPVISRQIQKNAYIIASDLLRLTTICLQFTPPFIACICIYLASVLTELPINSNNWCSLIDPTISLKDVQREAQQFKGVINLSHLSIGDKKTTTQSIGSSPDSAYSSGGQESPDISNFEQKPQNLKTQSIVPKINNNEDNVKKRAFEKMGVRLQMKNPSILLPTPIEKTTSLLKNTTINCSLSSMKKSIGHSIVESVNKNGNKRPNDDQIRAKFQKVVKSNDQIVRQEVQPQTKHEMDSAVKQVKSSSSVNQSSNASKQRFKSLNVKITFDSTEGKRVVCRPQQLVNQNHF